MGLSPTQKGFYISKLYIIMGYKENTKKVSGKNRGDVFIFALSTCGWCAKAKALMNNLGIEYRYVDVDLLDNVEQKEVGEQFEKYNTGFSFPKIIINKKVISGFDELKIREALK
jgi:glutaredoxin-like protein NrdH